MPVKGGSGGGSAAADIRAGGASFELFARENISAVLSKLKSRVASFGSFMSSFGNKTALVGAAALAPVTALFKGGVDRAADVARMSQEFGVPIELMSKLQYAAEQAGVSVQDVMNDTEGRFTRLIQSAPTIDPANAQKALEYQREMASATHALQQATLPLLDVITPLVKQIAEFAKNNAGAVRTVAALGAGLVVVGGTLSVAGFGLAGIVSGIAALIPVVAAAVPVLKVLAGAAGAAVAVGILYGAAELLGLDLREFFGWLKGGAVSVVRVLADAWGGITSAIGKGDWAQAGKVAMAGLTLAWGELVHELTILWIGFKAIFVDGWHGAVAEVELLWNELAGTVRKLFQQIIREGVAGASVVAAALGQTDLAAALTGLGTRTLSDAAIDAETMAKNKKVIAGIPSGVDILGEKNYAGKPDSRARASRFLR